MATVNKASDLGTMLTDYAKGNTDSGLIEFLQRMNLPLTADTVTFLQNEQDMAIASGNTGIWNSWALPAGKDSRTEFFALDSAAAQFAAASGWRFFPTPRQLQFAVEHGVATMTTQQIWSFFAGLNPKGTASMPWLQAGMNKENYTNFNNRLIDTWQQYTGNTDAPQAVLQQAAQNNWSAQRFQQFIQNDPGTIAKYGWIQHGMTYDQFQQYKLSNKQQAAARFGNGAGDSQYLTMLKDPLSQFNAQSAAIQSIPQAASGPATQGASSFGRQSEAH